MEDVHIRPNASSTLPNEQISAPAARKVLSAQDWESKKAIIRSLYITDDLSLGAVVLHMTQKYNFKATSVGPIMYQAETQTDHFAELVCTRID